MTRLIRRFIGRTLNRREFLAASAATSAAAVAAVACAGDDNDDPSATATSAPAQSESTVAATSAATMTATERALAPTPACGDDDDDPTPDQTEGPFFTPNSPERTSLLESGVVGEPLVVSGRVLFTDCAVVSGALIDFWQCDADGEYDNVGYTLRGHQFTDGAGNYRLETIKPGLYPGRTRHIHVKVQAPNQAVLTTQLYFPDEPANASDGIFVDALVMTMPDAATGRFDFVLARVSAARPRTAPSASRRRRHPRRASPRATRPRLTPRAAARSRDPS